VSLRTAGDAYVRRKDARGIRCRAPAAVCRMAPGDAFVRDVWCCREHVDAARLPCAPASMPRHVPLSRCCRYVILYFHVTAAAGGEGDSARASGTLPSMLELSTSSPRAPMKNVYSNTGGESPMSSPILHSGEKCSTERPLEDK